MRRLILTLTACLPLFCGCSDSGKKNGEKAAGEIFAVGFDEDFAPFTFLAPSGKAYAGYDLDLAQEVARRNSWNYVPVPMDWRMKEVLLNSDKIDCIWSSFHMNNREDLFEWSRPYMNGEQVVVVRGDSPVRNVSDLAGKTVAVQAGSINYDVWTDGPAKHTILEYRKFIPVESFSLLMRNFADKAEYDAVVTDAAAAAWWRKHCGTDLRIIGEPVLKTPCGIAFRRGNRKLRDQVQKTLDAMAADGTLARIGEKWFGHDISGPAVTAEAE